MTPRFPYLFVQRLSLLDGTDKLRCPYSPSEESLETEHLGDTIKEPPFIKALALRDDIHRGRGSCTVPVEVWGAQPWHNIQR